MNHIKTYSLAWIIAAILASPALAQISPGPLSNPHQHLEGPTQCTSCHILGLGTPRYKCANCHGEISQRVQAKTGFHGRNVKLAGGAKAECVRCHTDHYGRNFNIIRWETSYDEFDHRQAGYPLQGKHAALSCDKCHAPKNISAERRQGIKEKDLRHTYLGLTTQCAGCHADTHKGQLGSECATCHTNFRDWKPETFDHSKSNFPLTGVHTKVDCARCHKPVQTASDAKAFTPFKGLPFSSCKDCHTDPHNGAFTNPCASCHSTLGWKQIGALSDNFDHTRTKFALKGLHGKVTCEKCHTSVNFKEPVAHGLCADCHRDDPHKGQFAGKDCEACHNEAGFKPSLFDLSRHQKSVYPLIGKHEKVECAKCHPAAAPDAKTALYRVKHEGCADCHKDTHGDQFRGEPYQNRCEQCHTEHGFKPSTFSFTRHQKTRFVLAGGHAATTCAECHKVPAGFDPPPPAQYHFTDLTCTGCHTDPHRGQFEAASKTNCEGCHNTRSWKQTAAFDHDTTKFKLAGAHRAVRCTECHRPTNMGVSVRQVIFQNASTECAGCHEDIHESQFVKDGKTDCSACHSELAWKPTRFDHERQAKFSLAGSHKAVPCGSCHVQVQNINGRETKIYKATPSECSACHSSLGK